MGERIKIDFKAQPNSSAIIVTSDYYSSIIETSITEMNNDAGITRFQLIGMDAGGDYLILHYIYGKNFNVGGNIFSLRGMRGNGVTKDVYVNTESLTTYVSRLWRKRP